MKDKSGPHGNTTSFGAAASIDGMAGQYSVKAPKEGRGNAVAQPQRPEQGKEAAVTQNKADSSGLTFGQIIALLAFVAALFGMSVQAIISSSNARFDDINARLDRLEFRINERFDDVDERFNDVDERFDDVDERFDELEAKVDANTEAIASLIGESVLATDASDSS